MLKEAFRRSSRKSNCPVCGSMNVGKFWAMPKYYLSQCSVCGMIWDPDPPEDLKSVYTENYFLSHKPKVGYANYFEGMKVSKKTFYERIKRINKKVGDKTRMLDIGTAFGDSLLEARKLGWKNLNGVEVSDYAVRESRKRGLDVKSGTLESANYPSNYFDAVTLQDVIEHVKDPKVEVKEIYRVLKPGGIVFIVAPDAGNILRKLLGSHWYHYQPGEHLMYFSRKTLAKVLRDANFKKVKMGMTYHIMSLESILTRLKYYIPWFFEFLLKLVRNNFLGKLSFRVYADEMEGWGQK